MKRIIYLIFTVLLLWSVIYSQSGEVSNVGTTAAPFLQIGVGARAIGMGGAFVSTADDITAIYWNPAGIGRLGRPELLFVHTNWIADINFDYAAAVIPLGRFGTVGASITSLSMEEMKVRTIGLPEGTGEFFNAGDISLGLSYGFNITDRFSIGLNAKYISQKIWKESATGFGIDIGTLFTTAFHGLRIGATMLNFGTDMQMDGDDLLVYHDIDEQQLGNNDRIFAKLETSKWPLPLVFQAGIAMEIYETRSHRLTLAAEAVHPNDNSESVNFGTEYGFREFFFLRGGYRNMFQLDGEEGFTLGAGFSARVVGNFKIVIDYAYADFGRLENVQRYSLILKF